MGFFKKPEVDSLCQKFQDAVKNESVHLSSNRIYLHNYITLHQPLYRISLNTK